MKPIYLLAGCLAFACVNASAIVIDIDTQATYLRTEKDFGTEIGTGVPYSATDTIPIELAALGFAPGDQVSLMRIGSYRYWPRSVGTLDEAFGMVGVFSSTSDLLASSELNRVSGALDAGTDFFTGETFNGALTTDITQDFGISGTGVSLQIPAGAKYLFVSAADTLFWDNTAGADGFKLSMSKVSTAVPDSSQTLVLAGMGLLAIRFAGGLSGWRRTR